MKAGPGTTLTITYELKGPLDLVVASTDGKPEQLEFAGIDDTLAALLEGKEPGDYCDAPDIIPGTVELEATLKQRGVALTMVVPRADLPSGTIRKGQGFLNEDAAGRDLPFVVTRIQGDEITLSKVACTFRYRIHDVKPAGATSFGLEPTPEPPTTRKKAGPAKGPKKTKPAARPRKKPARRD